MTRQSKLLFDLDLGSMRGLEIGPLTSPLVSKSESRFFYIDHADRETLCQKCENPMWTSDVRLEDSGG
jgi:hypothetical protein